jgi:hypothetical protein
MGAAARVREYYTLWLDEQYNFFFAIYCDIIIAYDDIRMSIIPSPSFLAVFTFLSGDIIMRNNNRITEEKY